MGSKIFNLNSLIINNHLFNEAVIKLKSFNRTKVVDAAYKALEVISICFRDKKNPCFVLVNVIRDGYDFYWTYKNLSAWKVFWKNSLSNSSIDQEILKISIESLVKTKNKDVSDKVISQIFNDVMKRDFESPEEVIEIVKDSIEEQKLKFISSGEVEKSIKICKRSRPILKPLANIFYTIGGLGDNAMALKTWNILDLSKVAVEIGKHSRVFQVLVRIGAGTVLTAVYSVGFFITLGESSYRIVVQIHRYRKASNEEKEIIQQKLKAISLEWLYASVNLAAIFIPLVCPPVGIPLALIAKGVGLYTIYAS